MSEVKDSSSDIEKFEKCEILEEEYIVEKILDKKKINGVWKYKVKWEGYSEEECTWEPKENLRNVKYLIDEFEGKPNDKDKNKTEKQTLLKNKTKRSNNESKDEEVSNSITLNDKRGPNGATVSQKNVLSNKSTTLNLTSFTSE